jgi:hypothetical protein
MSPRLSRAAAIVGAWIPIFFFWLLLAMVYGQLPLAMAAPLAAVTVGVAALLGVGVARFCAWRPWPDRLRAGFYATHVAAASIYAVLWIAGTTALEPLVIGNPMSLRKVISSPVLGWQLFMGLWLYGVTAGIAYAFQIQRRARESERRALAAEAHLSAARLEALKNRLHPHFLFNALHTVGALVREDPATAEAAIEKLGEVLRYSLVEPPGGVVPFRDEWAFTQRYLEFEQLRFGDRLAVSSSIDDDCVSFGAPPFALQTLVENAVRHAVGARVGGGRIEITARASERLLTVRVRDDGDAAPAADGTGFGLPALRARLQAIYGDEARLTLDRGERGFDVSFTVPRPAAGDDDA